MLKTGDIINERYEIKEQIGLGGNGVIYKAYHLNMKKDVALKLIKNASAEELENRSEIDLIKNLKNKYLPIFYDFVHTDTEVYTVMEFIDGHDIKKLMDMGRNFSEEEIIKYGKQLCEAVNELHSQRPPIIHGDIKPANVMLTAAGNICLIDFNISAIVHGSKASAKGYSKDYAAPEQTFTSNNYKCYVETPIEDEFHEETRFLFNNGTEKKETLTKTLIDEKQISDDGLNKMQAFIDCRTDIFGIGAVLYYMVTGYPPINGKPDFSEVKISPKIRGIITKAMSPDPADRYKTAGEMEAAFDSNKVEKVKVSKTSSYKKSITGIACAAVILAAAAAGIIAITGKDKSGDAADTAVIIADSSDIMTVPASTAADATAEEIPIENDTPAAEGYFRFCTPNYRIDVYKDYIKCVEKENDPLNDHIALQYCLDENTFSYLSIDYLNNAVDSKSGYDIDVAGFLSEWVSRTLDVNEYTPNEYQVIDEHTETINGKECTFLEINYYIDQKDDIIDNTFCTSFLIYGFVQERDICIVSMYGTTMDAYGTRYDESLWNRKYMTGLYKVVDTLEMGNYLDPNKITICGDTYPSSVKSLSLSCKEVKDEDIFALSYFKELEKLDLSGTDISDISAVSSLTALECIDLSNTNVKKIDALKNCDLLKMLNISNTKTNSLYGINTGALEYLDLSGTDVEYLGLDFELSKLKGLILGDRVSEYEITKLTEYGINELEILALDGMIINEWTAKELNKLPKVKRLFLTDVGLDKPEYFENLPVTEELYVGGNGLTDIDIETIKGYLGNGCKIFSDDNYDVNYPPYNFPEIN